MSCGAQLCGAGSGTPGTGRRVPPGSLELGCAVGGGVTGQLVVSFAVAGALDRVCLRQLCPLSLLRPWNGEVITALWGALQRCLPCQVLEYLLLSDSKEAER